MNRMTQKLAFSIMSSFAVVSLLSGYGGAKAKSFSETEKPLIAQTTTKKFYSPFRNNAIAKQFFETAWNTGKFEEVINLIDPDVVDHSPVSTEKGPEGFKKIVGTFRAALPDIKLTVDDEVYTGNKVVHRWTVQGTHTGEPLFGVKPSGKPVKLTGITILRFKDGKIVERWTQLDQFGLSIQLGLIPKP